MNIKSSDLVIFDCDGVLVDSEPLANRVFVQIVRENGYDLDEDKYLNKLAGAHRGNCTRTELGTPRQFS